MRTLQKIAIAALLAVPAAAQAQEVGDIEAGHAYAKKVCAECHAVERGEKESPYLDLPSFQAVADEPAITGRALAVWLTNPHPNMPNFILPQADTRQCHRLHHQPQIGLPLTRRRALSRAGTRSWR